MEGKGMDQILSIGQLAKQAGVNIQTVRYYERRNILNPHRRKKPEFTIDHPGYRLYTEEAVKKIKFIKNAQRLGFTIKEISGLLRLRVSHRSKCNSVRRKAEYKLKDVEEKITQLENMKKSLKDLIRACQRKSTTDHCPILNSLEV